MTYLHQIKKELEMKKIIVATVASVFLLGSTATFASGNLESLLPFMAAQDILNKMGCEGKKAGDKIKDRTDGEMITCPAKMKNKKSIAAAK